MDLFKKCLFCNEDRDGILWSSSLWYVQYDLFPVSPGHVEVIPTRHVARLDQLVEEERLTLSRAVDMAKYLVRTTDWTRTYHDAKNDAPEHALPFLDDALASRFLKKKPDGYNIGVNEGAAAGQTIPHLHIHLIPRYKGDVPNPVGGVRNIIPGKGDYKK